MAKIGTPGHILGADEQGRDILSRLLWGTRISLAAAVLPVLVSALISLVAGLVAGYFQGWVGEVIMRILDVWFAFPAVLLAIAISAILGPGLLNVMIAMVVVRIPYMTRVAYVATVQERVKEYVESARACGAPTSNLIFSQIMPNVIPTLIVYCTTIMGLTIVTVSGLSFFGLGVQPPMADWGRMAADGRAVLLQGHMHVSAVPGLAILLLSLAFNLLGDGVRNALDPRQRTE